MTEHLTPYVLDHIPFEPDLALLLKRLHIKEGTERASEFNRLFSEAIPLAHPRALYRVAYIGKRAEDWIEIGGRRFNSRVLSVNLEQAHRTFPFLATCGNELQQWADGKEDMLHNFWAEAIKETALQCAMRALGEHIEQTMHPGKTAMMNPGSLQDWPLQQQPVLFDLFGGAQDSIGVQLTDSLLMVPTKTVSGIRFPTEADFESCQLCPRDICPGRRAPFEPALPDSRYGLN